MQMQATLESNPIEVTQYHMKRIILLQLVPTSEDGARRFYSAGEMLYVAPCEKPHSFMDCETIHLSSDKPFKSAVDSWRGRNRGTPHFFTIERSMGGYY